MAARPGGVSMHEEHCAGDRQGALPDSISPTNRSLRAVAEPDSRDAVAVGVETNDTSQRTGRSTVRFGGIELATTLLAAPGVTTRNAGTELPRSTQKPLSRDRGSCSLCARRFVNKGLRTGDLGSETGGPTWGLGEKPPNPLPCSTTVYESPALPLSYLAARKIVPDQIGNRQLPPALEDAARGSSSAALAAPASA